MNPRMLLLFVVVAVGGCGPKVAPATAPGGGDPVRQPPAPEAVSTGRDDPKVRQPVDGAAASLPEAKKGFTTKIVRKEPSDEPVEQPPAKLFAVVKYTSPAGDLPAYLTPDPKNEKKHPAIVWITGGDCNTIGDVWSDAPAKNDQSAAAYRKAGLVMMFPSLRGGNKGNPGRREGFFGEVDDVLAATEYLRKQPHVDPDRVYLGGHSTGGTLALLVVASSDKFRAVFAFGPVGDPAGYGGSFVYCNPDDAREMGFRSPEKWVNTIKVPTFVIEGSGGNISSLRAMAKASTNANVRYLPVQGADHFEVLAPVNKLIADRILKDTDEKTNLAFTEAELAALFKKK